ncbi:MAG: LysR substrate-binding domain-containing protein [Rhodanobacter sp.]
MIEELRIFLAVTAAGNFSRVARDQNMAVSSVTRKIDMLEAELGVKLFRRSSRLVLLTDAGERFVLSARSIVAELDDAKDALAELQVDPRGVLSVTAPAAFGRRHVIPVVSGFLERYPQIELELHLSDQAVDLAAQRVDLAIRMGSLLDSDMVATRLAGVRRVACASPEYIARHGRPAGPEDLLKHNCLTVASGHVPHGWWSFPGVQHGIALPVHGSLRSNDTEALLQAAVDGLGVVHLASWLVCDMLAEGKLVSLFAEPLMSALSSSSAIHAVRLPGRSNAAKAHLFVDHLKEAFGEPAYWDSSQITQAPTQSGLPSA